MIERLYRLATTGDTTTVLVLLAILLLLGIVLGLGTALLIYWQDRKQNCSWCHAATAGGICFSHARMMRRQQAYRRGIRAAVQKQRAEQRKIKRVA